MIYPAKLKKLTDSLVATQFCINTAVRIKVIIENYPFLIIIVLNLHNGAWLLQFIFEGTLFSSLLYVILHSALISYSYNGLAYVGFTTICSLKYNHLGVGTTSKCHFAFNFSSSFFKLCMMGSDKCRGWRDHVSTSCTATLDL